MSLDKSSPEHVLSLLATEDFPFWIQLWQYLLYKVILQYPGCQYSFICNWTVAMCSEGFCTWVYVLLLFDKGPAFLFCNGTQTLHIGSCNHHMAATFLAALWYVVTIFPSIQELLENRDCLVSSISQCPGLWKIHSRCISYFSYCCHKIPYKGSLVKEGLQRDTHSPSWRGGCGCKHGGGWLRYTHSQEAEWWTLVFSYSFCFSYFLSSSSV